MARLSHLRHRFFGQARSHPTGGGLSDSNAAKPIVAFIFPVAAGVIIAHEPSLVEMRTRMGKPVFRRQDFPSYLKVSCVCGCSAVAISMELE